MKLLNILIEKPTEINFILAQSHFIKTVEDILGIKLMRLDKSNAN